MGAVSSRGSGLQQQGRQPQLQGDDDEEDEEDEGASLVTIEEEEGLDGSQQGEGRRGSVHFGRGWSAALA